MVQTTKDSLKADVRVFVIAGALHTPHYEFASIIEFERKFPPLFAAFLAHPGAKENEINDAFYGYFDFIAGDRRSTTKSIFDFLKDKDFAVLIPKNLPQAKALESYFPINAR